MRPGVNINGKSRMTGKGELAMAKMKKVKRMARATFRRDMYPGVTFCERCFCHHNQIECPFPLAAFNPTYVQLEGVTYADHV
jgi:hypothetical protein